MPKKFYVTTPIYYVNDKPHIGHAYTTIAADVVARYHRLLGEEVMFLTGTDEHGLKNEQSALKAGLTPQAFVDEKAAAFQLAWDQLNISYDDFLRTTQARHRESVAEFLNNLQTAQTPLGQPAVYRGTYEGLYCVGCESYKTASDLVDGKCPDHNKAPELLKEENWFFRLSDYTAAIRDALAAGETVVAPEARRNEVLGLLDQGLKDIAMSRRMNWGVKLPFDNEQVAWVWFDALPNYISALGYPAGEQLTKFWPADVQLMAKDILKFHTVIWLALLMAVKLPLPKKVFAHGFFTVDGQKMSKTIGNVIDPIELTAEYGVDPARFFLLSEVTFGADGDISVERFKERYNSHLANGLGNVVSRVLTLVEKYRDQMAGPADEVLAQATADVWSNYHSAMEQLQFEVAIGEVWRLLSLADSYIEEHKPWELAKTDPAKLGVVLANLVEILRQVGWLLYPIMPETAEKILTAFGVWATERALSISELSVWGRPVEYQNITKPTGLFPRRV